MEFVRVDIKLKAAGGDKRITIHSVSGIHIEDASYVKFMTKDTSIYVSTSTWLRLSFLRHMQTKNLKRSKLSM